MRESLRPLHGGRLLLLASAVLVLLAFGCSSSEFGPTGSDLPADVSQDSLAIPLTVTGTAQEQRFDMPLLDPPQGAPINEREFLYFGTRSNVGLKATPFIQFDFSDIRQAALDSLQAEPDQILELNLTLRMGKYDDKQAMHVGIYELSSPLDSTMVEDPVATHLGEELGEFLSLGGETHVIDLLEGRDPGDALALKQKIVSWMVAGKHNGIALVDLDSETPLVSAAARQFNLSAHQFLLWDTPPEDRPEVKGTFVVYPIFSIDYCKGCAPEAKDNGFIFGTKQDLTVFERSQPSSKLVLASHLARRVWLNFDLSSIPPAATINSAELVLHIDKDHLVAGGVPGELVSPIPDSPSAEESARATGDRTFDNSTLTPISLSAVVYEASAQDSTTVGLPQVLDALTTLRPDVILSGSLETDTQLRVNIADYTQRLVNGIFGSDPPGLLLAFANEQLEYFEVPFFDSTASDSLRPRVEIRFTPPADFGN